MNCEQCGHPDELHASLGCIAVNEWPWGDEVMREDCACTAWPELRRAR